MTQKQVETILNAIKKSRKADRTICVVMDNKDEYKFKDDEPYHLENDLLYLPEGRCASFDRWLDCAHIVSIEY